MENYISNHHGDNKNNVFSFPHIIHPELYSVLVDALLCFALLGGGVLHASMSTRIEGA
jgi:hypothetical protein